MTKRGTDFERVVAEIVRAFDPSAIVRQGLWIPGPDGRRDLDVYVEGVVDGATRRAVIECKDFDPAKTGVVGIGIVDALDSKRSDLGIDVAFICSNAGFTADAARKAKRVSIGLLAVMRSNDKRVKFAVMDYVYTRRVTVEHLAISLRGSAPIPLDGLPFDDVTYQGFPVGNWVVQRASTFLTINPVVSGSFTATFRLKQPTIFDLADRSVEVLEFAFSIRVRGSWYEQQVTIDSTGALYDWLKRRLRLLPGPGNTQFKNFNPYGGVPVATPPRTELDALKQLDNGEVAFQFVILSGLGPPEKQPQRIPDITPLVVEADLDLQLLDPPASVYTSQVA